MLPNKRNRLSASQRRQRPAQDEHAEQAALIQWRDLDGIRTDHRLALLFAIPNGGRRSIGQAVKLKKEGVRAGVWDLCLPVPMMSAPALWVEMKSGNGTLTPGQRKFRKDLEPLGHLFFVAYRWEDAALALVLYLRTEFCKVEKSLPRGVEPRPGKSKPRPPAPDPVF